LLSDISLITMHQLNHSKAAASAMAAAAAATKEAIERPLHCLQAGQSKITIMLAPCAEADWYTLI